MNKDDASVRSDTIKVSYAVANSVVTRRIPMHELSMRNLGLNEFADEELEYHAVQMFGGMFGSGIFLCRSVKEWRIMERERDHKDPPAKLHVMAVSKKPFANALS